MPQPLETLMHRITSGLALLGAAAVVLMLAHVTAYVVLRHVLSAPVPATVEIVSSYYMIAVAFLPLAWAERRGDMIVVEVFGHLYPKPVRRWIDALVFLTCCAAYSALTYTTFLVALREFTAKSFVISLSLAVPTWPGYFVLPVSFALAALVCFHKAATVLLATNTGGDATQGTVE